MIYLASPYSHDKATVRRQRYHLAQKCVGHLMLRNIPVFSPIVHCHNVAISHKLPLDAEYWWNYNRQFLRRSNQLLILAIDGWRESAGVKQEAECASLLGLSTIFVDENGGNLKFLNAVAPSDESN